MKVNGSLSSKLQDVRVKIGSKVIRAKAKKVGGKVKVFVTPNIARKLNPNTRMGVEFSSRKAAEAYARIMGGTWRAVRKSTFSNKWMAIPTAKGKR